MCISVALTESFVNCLVLPMVIKKNTVHTSYIVKHGKIQFSYKNSFSKLLSCSIQIGNIYMLAHAINLNVDMTNRKALFSVDH